MAEENSDDAESIEEIPKVEEKFSLEELPSNIRENATRLGWTGLMPVQESVIPYLLSGKDVVVQSRTGSGKTGAFVLPLCLKVDPKVDEVQGLVLVPTRELAEQVHSVLQELLQGVGVRTIAVYGGVPYEPQIEAFNDKVQVIVATPGRIIDHLLSRRVSISKLRTLVLDEADEMLSMGFYESMMKILAYVPKKRQTALFSATISKGVSTLAGRFTYHPEMISLSSDVLHVEEVDHVYYVVDPMEKDRALLYLSLRDLFPRLTSPD
jgi:ATP-dependent RNA helicase DeaD